VKTLVTGGAGYIGSNLVKQLFENGEVSGIDTKLLHGDPRPGDVRHSLRLILHRL
jgi:nucleoside-diphosphate-sugar epimerase